jgi:predicted nucleic acid-binding Zn ribbon protein
MFECMICGKELIEDEQDICDSCREFIRWKYGSIRNYVARIAMEGAKMKCPKCESVIEDNAQKCVWCGIAVHELKN